MDVQKVPYSGEERVETGAVQFGDEDWPGVFIRGDNACYYAMVLRSYLARHPDPQFAIDQSVLEGLASLLGSCEVKG